MTAPLVELYEVDVRLAGRPVLSGISLVLREGESWAVLGANGSGKSTLLRLLRGEVWPHHEGPGRRVFHLSHRADASPIGVRERIGVVSAELQQEYIRRDWFVPVEAVIRSGFTDTVWPPEPATPEQAERIEEVLRDFGMAALSRQSALELSTGELRKVLLARAIVGKPRLLFLDEPCHGLDAPSRRSFLGLVSRIVRGGTPVVLATHRFEEILPEITRVAVLHGGRILAQGTPDEVLHRHRSHGAPGHPSTPRLRRSAQDERKNPLQSSDDERKNPAGPFALSAGRAAPEDPPFALSAGRAAPEDPPFALTAGRAAPVVEVPPSSPTRTLVAIDHADVLVDGKPVLHDISWTVRAGESWAVVGPNGAGKSTLLRLVVGDEQAMPGGRVSRLELGERADVWEVKARVGIVSPELQARHRVDLAAEDVVASGFTASIGLPHEPSAEQRATAARCMERVGVTHLGGRPVHALSYGEFRKLLVARALVLDPELLVLDEPADGLDPESRASLLETVESLCRGGTHVVMVTHHQEDLVPSIGFVLELARGRVVYSGDRSRWRGDLLAGGPR